MMLNAGHLLQGRYRILRLLGQGGMAAVYLAADARLAGREVAVKEMNPAGIPQVGQTWAMTAFQQEAQVLARLNHPGIAAVTDFFQDGNFWYLVMEQVPGETLEVALQRAPNGRFPESQVLAWAAQLGAVLSYLHSHNPPIVYRDLKPSNIMRRPDGTLKLIDFGIARFFKPGQISDTHYLGTPGYAAPEQYGHGQTDARSDVYSLGVLLHQLLTGYDPALTPVNLPPVRQLNPAVTPHVAAAITQALQVDPARRFSSVSAFVQALAGGSRSGSTRAVPSGPAVASRPNRALLAGSGAVILTVVAILIAWQPWARAVRPPVHSATPGAVAPTATDEPSQTRESPGTVLPDRSPTDTPKPATVPATPETAHARTPEPTHTPTASLAQIEAGYLQALPHYRPNGDPVFAYYVERPIQVDGRLDEWAVPRSCSVVKDPADNTPYDLDRWDGSHDLSGDLQVAWDTESFYLAVEVRDDVFVQIESGVWLYNGDSAEIQFDADLEGDYGDSDFGSDDYHIGFSPGDFSRRLPETYVWAPGAREGSEPAVDVAARQTGDGYILEMAIPWWVLGATRSDGAAFGFCLCIADNDRRDEAYQETMLCTHASRKWHAPASLGTLVLARLD